MQNQKLKADLDAVNRYLEETKNVDLNDPLFLLVAYAEGARDTLRAVIKEL